MKVVHSNSRTMERPTIKISQALLVVLPASYLLSLLWESSTLTRVAAMIPVNTFLQASYFWNVATHVLLEVEAVPCVVSCLLLATWGREIETEIGSTDFAKLLLVPTLSVSLGLIVGGALAARLLGSLWLFFAHCGFLPCAAMIALLKAQASPQDHVAHVAPSFIRVKHVPFSIVLFAIANDLLTADAAPTQFEVESGGVFRAGSAMTTCIGFFASWFFLRFLRQSAGVNGNPSPSFALHQLVFPVPFRLVMLTVGAALFPLVRVLGLGKEVAAASDAAQLDSASSDPVADAANRLSATPGDSAAVTIKPLPGSSAADADRRRADVPLL